MEILYYIGMVIIFIGGMGVLIAAFQESILWGIGCLLISPLSLIFIFLHWSEAKNAFFLQLIGLAVVGVSIFLGAVPLTI